MAATKAKPQLTLRTRALRMLARREYTRQDLEQKLAPSDDERAELEALLDDFEQRGWLSERRYVEQVLTVRRRRFGMERIARDFAEHGVSAEAVEGARRELAEDELAAARAVWRRKFKTPATTAADRARQVRFLCGRGFAMVTVMQVIKGGAEDDAVDE